MFDLSGMIGNLEERKVGRYKDGKICISTVRVTDSINPYETAIQHPLYNSGKWIVVEEYTSKGEAKEAHDKWVKKMTDGVLPDSLTDVSSSGMAVFSKAFGAESEFKCRD